MATFFTSQVLAAQLPFSAKFGQDGVEVLAGYFDTVKLQNVYDSSLLIDKIRFTAWRNNLTVFSNSPPRANLAVLDNYAVRFRVGDVYLSRDFIPIGLLCTDFDGNRNNVSQILGTGFQRASRQWTLPAPMLVKPHWALTCEIKQMKGPFYGADLAASEQFTVAVEYIGRNTENGIPKKILYPFVMQYVPMLPVVESFTAENDIYNPLDRPVRIQRLVGRQYMVNNEAGTDPRFYLMNHDTLPIAPDAMTVQIKDGYNYDVVPTSMGNPDYGIQPAFCPFGLVVDFYRAAQTFSRDLLPLNYMKCEFRKSTAAAYAAWDVYPWLAAIGTQEGDL